VVPEIRLQEREVDCDNRVPKEPPTFWNRMGLMVRLFNVKEQSTPLVGDSRVLPNKGGAPADASV
jgi:hypothetical protein